MATTEKNTLLQRKDASGNNEIIYPITKKENVDGLDEYVNNSITSNIDKSMIVYDRNYSYLPPIVKIKNGGSGYSVGNMFRATPNNGKDSNDDTYDCVKVYIKVLQVSETGSIERIGAYTKNTDISNFNKSKYLYSTDSVTKGIGVSGTGFEATVTIDSGSTSLNSVGIYPISNVEIVNGGSGYAVNDFILRGFASVSDAVNTFPISHWIYQVTGVDENGSITKLSVYDSYYNWYAIPTDEEFVIDSDSYCMSTGTGTGAILKFKFNSIPLSNYMINLGYDIESLNTFKNTKGQNNGIAELDENGKVPIAQLPASDNYSIVESTTTEGYAKTYSLIKNGVETGTKINIPKDLVINQGSVKVVATADTPYTGAKVGDKYLDIELNDPTKNHIYIAVKDLVDVYKGSNSSKINITIGSDNIISASIVAGSIEETDLTTELQTKINSAIKSINNITPDSNKNVSLDASKINVDDTAATKQTVKDAITETKNSIPSNIVNGSALGSLRTKLSNTESDTYTMGSCAFAEGMKTMASGKYSHAEGFITNATSDCSHAEGFTTVATGSYSHAEGYRGAARGLYSHVEGGCSSAAGQNIASGEASHSEGSGTVAEGECSHAEGGFVKAKGQYSHAEGSNTIASADSQHVQGRNNIESSNYSHILGNGTDSDHRSNAHTIDWQGNTWYSGIAKIGGTSFDDANAKELATKEYVDSKSGSIPKWTNLTLLNNWFHNGQTMCYRRVNDIVYLQGAANRSSINVQSADLTICQLPSDCCPKTCIVRLPVYGSFSQSGEYTYTAQLMIDTTGKVSVLCNSHVYSTNRCNYEVFINTSFCITDYDSENS